MTRTHNKWLRVYMDGVDISGYSRQVGTLGWSFEAQPDTALTDAVKNILIGEAEVSAGPINAFMDNDVAGLLALAKTGIGTRNLMVALGQNALPKAGDPVFAWIFEQKDYQVTQGTGFVSASIPMGGASFASTKTYKRPWGVLLHASAIRLSSTGVNADIGIDDNGGASALGGIFIYHLFTSNGTVTLSAQDAAVNNDGGYATSGITGATSGSIDASTAPKSGMIALSTTNAVRQYLRWQIAFGSATTCTFASAFIRNNI
jgi:hypothetical protein